jgi:hypothetical protein
MVSPGNKGHHAGTYMNDPKGLQRMVALRNAAARKQVLASMQSAALEGRRKRAGLNRLSGTVTSAPQFRSALLQARRIRNGTYRGLGIATGTAIGTATSLANEIQTYQSGASVSDTVSGLETGAGVGTLILPGIGTAIGALVGAAGGAIASAFGGGRPDPETQSWNAFIAAYSQDPSVVSKLSAPGAYQMLAGIMDAKNNTPGHSSALELAFGRAAEGSVIVQMAQVVNAAALAGQIKATDTPVSVYTRIVKPWLISKNAYIKPTDIISSNGSKAGGAVDALFEILIAAWVSGWLKSTTPMGIAGQPIAGLPPFVGIPKPAAAPTPAPVTTPKVSTTTAAPSVSAAAAPIPAAVTTGTTAPAATTPAPITVNVTNTPTGGTAPAAGPGFAAAPAATPAPTNYNMLLLVGGAVAIVALITMGKKKR